MPLLKENPDLATAIDLYDSWIRYTMHQKHQPGLAVGIVLRPRPACGERASATPTSKPSKSVTLHTRFRIASISKTFTAVAILQLRDGG